MDKYKRKVKEFYKKYKWQCNLAVILMIIVFAGFHSARFYKTPIGKVIHVTTKESGTKKNYVVDNGTEEPVYTQQIKVKILNGDHAGEKFNIKNVYEYSRVDTEKYFKGDQVFLRLSGDKSITSIAIKGPRRDHYTILLIAILLFVVIIIGRKKGLLSMLSIGINIIIFLFAMGKYEIPGQLFLVCVVTISAFTILTLCVVNGLNKSSFAAIISSLITSAMTMGIFLFSMKFGGALDYSTLDYIVGGQDLDTVFIASISIAGLGAIMDVCVSMSATLNELLVKDPQISYKKLIYSGREVGHDIMGTMTNVLLFTYICGLIPLVLIEMKNGISLITIIKLHIPFEISRFLIGGIGIVLSIPVSLVISILLFKTLRRKKV